MPEWGMELLRFVFGQLGALGTICLGAAGYVAYLHHEEKEDHKETRKAMAELTKEMLGSQLSTIKVLTELKSLLESRWKTGVGGR